MDEIATFPKKRLSIIIEAPFLFRMLELLDSLDVPGYSVLPVIAGRGKSGPWRRDALTSEAGAMVQVLIVLDREKVPSVLRAVRKVLDRQIGIISLSDVEVLRPELF